MTDAYFRQHPHDTSLSGSVVQSIAAANSTLGAQLQGDDAFVSRTQERPAPWPEVPRGTSQDLERDAAQHRSSAIAYSPDLEEPTTRWLPVDDQSGAVPGCCCYISSIEWAVRPYNPPLQDGTVAHVFLKVHVLWKTAPPGVWAPCKLVWEEQSRGGHYVPHAKNGVPPRGATHVPPGASTWTSIPDENTRRSGVYVGGVSWNDVSPSARPAGEKECPRSDYVTIKDYPALGVGDWLNIRFRVSSGCRTRQHQKHGPQVVKVWRDADRTHTQPDFSNRMPKSLSWPQ